MTWHWWSVRGEHDWDWVWRVFSVRVGTLLRSQDWWRLFPPRAGLLVLYRRSHKQKIQNVSLQNISDVYKHPLHEIRCSILIIENLQLIKHLHQLTAGGVRDKLSGTKEMVGRRRQQTVTRSTGGQDTDRGRLVDRNDFVNCYTHDVCSLERTSSPGLLRYNVRGWLHLPLPSWALSHTAPAVALLLLDIPGQAQDRPSRPVTGIGMWPNRSFN